MELCFQVLERGKQVTQRELFYRLLCESPDYFTSQAQVNITVQGQCLISFLSHSIVSPDYFSSTLTRFVENNHHPSKPYTLESVLTFDCRSCRPSPLYSPELRNHGLQQRGDCRTLEITGISLSFHSYFYCHFFFCE